MKAKALGRNAEGFFVTDFPVFKNLESLYVIPTNQTCYYICSSMVVFELIYVLIWYVIISLVCKISIRTSAGYCIMGVLLAQIICLVILFSLFSIPILEDFLLEFDPGNITRKDLPYMAFFFVMLGIFPALISSGILKMAMVFENRRR